MGFVFDNIWREAGLPLDNTFIYSLQDDPASLLSEEDAIAKFLAEAVNHTPPIIVPLGWDATSILLPETKSRKKPYKASLDKYSGSLLKCPYIQWPHYAIPSYDPGYVCADWGYREIQVFIDFGHVKEEYEYYKEHDCLQGLPDYTLDIAPDYEKLFNILERYGSEGKLISSDIETIRPIKNSQFKGNPGFPYTIALANSNNYAVAFSLWDYDSERACRIWRLLDDIVSRVPQVGQNYFNFDLHYLEALGFKRICREKCQDTLIRHHILWPELEHKLQFQTRQYTRQPYYKDEGKGWSPRYKDRLLHYNALDAVVTYKIWEGQEEEFKNRMHLK